MIFSFLKILSLFISVVFFFGTKLINFLMQDDKKWSNAF